MVTTITKERLLAARHQCFRACYQESIELRETFIYVRQHNGVSLLVYGQFASLQRSAYRILKVRYIGMHVEHYGMCQLERKIAPFGQLG